MTSSDWIYSWAESLALFEREDRAGSTLVFVGGRRIIKIGFSDISMDGIVKPFSLGGR